MAAARTTAPYWFIGPAVVLMIVILIAPVLIAAVLSFTDYSLGNTHLSWVGFENYEKIASHSTYVRMLSSTATYVLVVVPASVALGLGAALLITSVRFARNLYKTIFFLPVMAALLAMAIVWELALHPTIGIVNDLLEAGCGAPVEAIFGWGWLPFVDGAESWYATACASGDFPLWLRDPDYAIWTVCFIGIWQAFGFNMVLYLAG